MAASQVMVPTLQVVSGPLAGRLYKLDRDAILIGRNAECDIVLEPKSVSRKHAAIIRKGAVYEIKDLESTRGTFVDGRRVKQPVQLKDGETIQIGEILLGFSSRAVRIQDEADDQSTVYAAIDVLNPSDFTPPFVKPEDKLRALRLISQELGGALVLSEVLDRVFKSLFEVFPRAERGFVLLKEPGTERLIPELIRSRTGEAGELTISKTILNRSLKEGEAILCKDVAKEFPDSTSASDARLRSLMCAPLLDQQGRPMGVMQIDTRDGRGRFEEADLDILASVASQISVAVQNAQMHKALIKQREMEQELQSARLVMQSLLPERPASVPGYDFWAYYEPARHVGGDYYGFIPLGVDDADSTKSKRWAIAVGDVVGKGMPAALMAAKLSAEVRLYLRGNKQPEQLVQLLNRHFEDRSSIDMYITFLLLVLDVDSNRLQVVNAGHPPPLIRRRDGRVEEFGANASGLPLFIVPGFDYASAETTLEPGETVILYTDGVTDAVNAAGDRLGEPRLRQALLAAKGAAAVGEWIVRAVQQHVADHPQFDDITLVAIARQ